MRNPHFIRTALLGISLVMGLVACVASNAHAETAQVFIVAGQSNASGRTSSIDLPAELASQPEVLYWFETDRGFRRDRFFDLRPLQRSFGPEISLGRTLADNLSEQVVIVKVAFGGTVLASIEGRSDWSPDSSGELYDKLISNLEGARDVLVADGKDVNFAGLFWMQGESDGKSGTLGGGQTVPPQPDTANAYEANLAGLIDNLRTDLATPSMPAFIGQIKIGDDPGVVTVPDSPFNTTFGEWDYTPVIQASQAAVAAADPNAYLIETGDISLGSDFLHFDEAGQLALGNAFAASYLQTTVP